MADFLFYAGQNGLRQIVRLLNAFAHEQCLRLASDEFGYEPRVELGRVRANPDVAPSLCKFVDDHNLCYFIAIKFNQNTYK